MENNSITNYGVIIRYHDADFLFLGLPQRYGHME